MIDMSMILWTLKTLEMAMNDNSQIKVPSYIAANAKRGLEYNSEGLGGKGLVDRTIREARKMAKGSVSYNKLRRMAAWFARHESDLKSPKNNDPNHEDYPGPGAVAWLLWGGNPTSDPMKAYRWCVKKVESIESASKKKKSSLGTLILALNDILYGDQSRYEISEGIKKGLTKKVKDHNEEHGGDKRKKTNLRTLVAVFKRGVGAYKTNPESVRPTVKSPEQWAYARVNSFLYCLRNFKFRSGKHDTDLLPKEHPLSTRK